MRRSAMLLGDQSGLPMDGGWIGWVDGVGDGVGGGGGDDNMTGCVSSVEKMESGLAHGSHDATGGSRLDAAPQP